MSEIHVYHLQRQPLEAVLPTLLGRSRERGWRALVRVGSEERMRALDDHLWSFSDESFLPHGTDREADAAEHPVLLTTREANPNAAEILFLADGAPLPAEIGAYQRVAIMLDGADDEAVASTRALWRELKAAGHSLAYWQQDEDGRWANRG